MSTYEAFTLVVFTFAAGAAGGWQLYHFRREDEANRKRWGSK